MSFVDGHLKVYFYMEFSLLHFTDVFTYVKLPIREAIESLQVTLSSISVAFQKICYWQCNALNLADPV